MVIGPGNPTIWVVVKIMVTLLGPLNNRCRTIIGTLILTTTHLNTWTPRVGNHGDFYIRTCRVQASIDGK